MTDDSLTRVVPANDSLTVPANDNDEPGPSTRALKLHVVTAGVILDQRGRVLIARRAPERYIPGLWEFPGGKLEPDESPEACLARELMEELGIEVMVGELLTAVHHTYERYRIVLLAYRCFLSSPRPEAPKALTDEHDRVEWVAPEAIEGGGERGERGERGGCTKAYTLLEADVPILRRVLALWPGS